MGDYTPTDSLIQAAIHYSLCIHESTFGETVSLSLGGEFNNQRVKCLNSKVFEI
jgi:hypothetical protein